jgi:hypothetical protein
MAHSNRPRRISPRIAITLVLLLGIAAAGCVSAATPPTSTPIVHSPLPTATSLPAPSPTPGSGVTPAACTVPSEWEVNFEQTGGFAGVSLRLEVKSSGEAEASDLESGNEEKFRLSPAQVDELEALFPSACPGDPGRPPPCMDCFDYLLQVELGGENYEIHTNDIGLEDHPARSLIEFLRELLQDALSPGY